MHGFSKADDIDECFLDHFGKVKRVTANVMPYLCCHIIEYTAGGCTVKVVSLDISKAFDKVNLYGLANKLLKRNVPRQSIKM